MPWLYFVSYKQSINQIPLAHETIITYYVRHKALAQYHLASWHYLTICSNFLNQHIPCNHEVNYSISFLHAFFSFWVIMRPMQLMSTVNSRYSGHPWDYPKWLEYRDGRISGYLEIPAAIFETVSRASSPACKVIVTG